MTDRKPKQDWRKKFVNTSKQKYTQEEFLKIFKFSSPPTKFNVPSELLLLESEAPVLSYGLSVSCSNPRKTSGFKEGVPEWYLEDAAPHKKLNIDDIEDNYSKVDVEYEDKLKKLIEEDDSYPDWDDTNDEAYSTDIISYPVSLISNQAKNGNPFACIILTHSTTSELYITPEPYSIPFEKVWFYKDPQNCTQGPFSTIEMFNWSAAGYFGNNLQIAHDTPTHFFSLQMYILQEKCRQNSITSKE
jgi:GYF domain